MDYHRPDPYAVLGVRRGATAAEITHAYRSLLRRHHPDTRAPDPLARSDGPSDGPDEADRTLGRIIAAYSELREAESRSAEGPGVPEARRSRRPPIRPTGIGDATDADTPPIRAGPVRWWLRG